MPEVKHKLTYFNIRGRGEIIRLVLRAAGVSFEDNRVELQDWPALKSQTPQGSLPLLEVDGNTYGQSAAIATYLAKEYDLYGSNNVERMIIDQIVFLRADLLVEEIKVAFGSKDDQERATGMRQLRDEVYPKYLGYFANMIYPNQMKTNSNFSVGNKLSLADLVIHEGTQSAIQNTTCVHAYPEIKNVRKAVEVVPGLTDYLTNRPNYPL